ncbi:MAG: YigZ family protein [Candidatus Cloacimonetes bacterium]|nr:YigZ family protein [Candidatus Cloacimonadota bacterium]
MSHWNTLTQPIEARLNIRRSRFIAWIAPASDAAEAARLVQERSQQFADATHNCYAWVTGWDRENTHYNDAGEPAGTAGKPIFNALMSAGLTNVVAVVTRYYGGVKLGVRGLIDAYFQSTQEALKDAPLSPAIPMARIWVKCDYGESESVEGFVLSLGGNVVDKVFHEQVETTFCLPKSQLPALCENLDGRRHQSGLLYRLEE